MQKNFEPWQLTQLTRMSLRSPERTQELLNVLWASDPLIFAELAIAAVDQEQLSVEACAELLSVGSEEVERQLLEFRQTIKQLPTALAAFAVVQGEAALARCPESGLSVWEIVRKYRMEGSWDKLLAAFPSVNAKELSMALAYAEEHREEIDRAIQHYDEMLEKRRSLYPFAR